MSERTSDGTLTTRGGQADGPAVIFVHGLGLEHGVWQWQIPALEDAFNCISYDLYGHGGSALSPAEPSLAVFSEQLGRVMDHWGVSSAAIVGFSLGGMIARRFAQDCPERVEALAILHSPHRRTPEAQQAILDRVEQARVDGSAATVEAALKRWFTDGFRAARPDVMDQVRAWVLANDIGIYHRNYRVLAEGIEEIVRPDPPISVPTLVMTGDEDYGNGPEMSAAIAAEIEGAELLILKGLRHMALAEDPEKTNVLLRAFLDRALRGVA